MRQATFDQQSWAALVQSKKAPRYLEQSELTLERFGEFIQTSLELGLPSKNNVELGEKMPVNQVLPDDHPVFALKAVMQYLVNSKKTTEAGLFNEHPLSKEAGFNAQSIGREFMRMNGRFDLYVTHFSHFQTAVQRLIETRKLPLPPYLYETAVKAGLSLPDRRPPGTPKFIDYNEIPELTGTLAKMRPFVDLFSGGWRFYRLSSRHADKSDQINVGFLNIKPYGLLEAARLPSPQFSLYQRGEDVQGGDGASILSKISGLMVHTSEHITLLGERTRSGGVGMPYVGHITWRHVDQGNVQHSKIVHGLSSIPNSEGQSMISAYFCAAFIEKSNAVDEKSYEQMKAAETDEKNSGLVDWTALRARLKDDNLIRALMQMIERSKRDPVLKA